MRRRPQDSERLLPHRLCATIVLGATRRSSADWEALLGSLRREWDGEGYSVLSRNCNDFSAALAERLPGVGRVPSWVNRAARLGRRLARNAECCCGGRRAGDG